MKLGVGGRVKQGYPRHHGTAITMPRLLNVMIRPPVPVV